MSVIDNIRILIEPAIEHMGYELVRIKWIGGSSNLTLQLMIEPQSGETTTVEDCEKVSERASAILDVEDAVKEAYRLEVSSPGIDRPLTRLKDFEKWQGFETKIETTEPIEIGANFRRRFKGKVTAINNGIIDFTLVGEPLSCKIPFDSISDAKLTLSDELVDFIMKDKKTA